MKNQKTLPSRLLRQKRMGVADQMAYEAKETHERDSMKRRMKEQKDMSAAFAGRARGRKSRLKEKGANAGTMGGARSMGSIFARGM